MRSLQSKPNEYRIGTLGLLRVFPAYEVQQFRAGTLKALERLWIQGYGPCVKDLSVEGRLAGRPLDFPEGETAPV